MKKTRKLLALLMVVVMAFSLMVLPAMAATVTDNSITFAGGGGGTPTGPVDPEDPSDPTVNPEPGKETPTGETGDCRLDLVPVFDFGSQQITAGSHTYYATVPIDQTTTVGMPYYVQLSDLRGTAKGWTLTAELVNQFANGTYTLTGATIDLKNIQAKAANPADAAAPSADQTLVYAGGTGSAVTLAFAGANLGMGVNTVHFGDRASTMGSSVALNIPASTTIYAGTYEGTIDWTLAATP